MVRPHGQLFMLTQNSLQAAARPNHVYNIALRPVDHAGTLLHRICIPVVEDTTQDPVRDTALSA